LPTDTPAASSTERIFFYSDRDGDGNWYLYVMNSNGSPPSRLVSMTSRAAAECGLFAGRLVYSPDRQQIAFVSDTDHSLYVMKADGSGLTRIVDGIVGGVGGLDGHTSWSPDGTQLAFAEFLPDTHFYSVHKLYVVKSDGSELTLLTGEENPKPWDIEWSPDGKQIAYNEQLGATSDISRIYIINADGSGKRPLTNEEELETMSQEDPAWSPDGKRIFFRNSPDSLADQQPPGLNIANADGSGQVKLTNNTADVTYSYSFYQNPSISFGEDPAMYFRPISPWSPDGLRIFFTTSSESSIHSFNVMNSDGSGLIPLTKQESLAYGPVWSPDRTQIAYVSRSEEQQTDNLYVLNVAELESTRLPISGRYLTDLAWSPDGNQIAYTSDLGGYDGQVYVVNADGSGLNPLSSSTGYKGVPIWSSDGERLFFQSSTDPYQPPDIYSIKADGSAEPTNLTNNPAADFFVSFGACGA
jgi:Tol biopolymer transport system component